MYEIDEKELVAIRKVFEKKKLFRYQSAGPGECDLFEREFARKIGTKHSLLVTSGTNALIAALAAAGVGPGDEVIIPAYTFVATATAVTAVGAIPVIANIDETLGISPAEARRLITDRTRAIIPVHMDGLSADLKAITKLARKHELVVIEDVAQAIGGSFQGMRLGSWGDFGCFSLNENKNISCGEGGIISVSKRAFYERVWCMQDASAQFSPVRKTVFRDTEPFMGLSMRVSEITGAVMRVQLKRLDPILRGLRARKKIFIERLKGQSRARVVLGNCAPGDCASSLHLLFEDPESAAAFGRKIRAKGVLFAPATARPAHACWKWTNLLGENATYPGGRNPYSMTDRKYSYHTAQYLDSIGILMRTLKMDIDLNQDPDVTAVWAERVARELSRG
ncbi:MAG TPA: aminotransferase class I/II-fold pyridoxal phosphate-dependent enzyme [Bdellovibrionota bacterium]|nr:aminotransferase class I/II-fold pyridoxal phosphate-dependent enzyme [Bdellovibrionota bacterium]